MDNDDDAAWRHVQRLEFLLRNADDLDEVARGVLTHLLDLPGVIRVGLALTEGAGRRLRFAASEDVHEAELPWCLIDAYDDVPLTAVTRTGKAVLGTLDQLDSRFPDVVAHQREAGTCALAAVPLPGVGSAIGGLVLFYETEQPFDAAQRRLLQAAARRTADAVRRIATLAAAGRQGRTPEESTGRSGHHARVELEGDPRAAGATRRFLREHLEHWGVDDDTIESAQLCASELVNNVIMHARSAFELNAHLEDRALTVTVRDLGGGAPGEARPHAPVVDEDAMRVFGRGLTLVDAIADRWGSEADAYGTIAWFVLELGNGSRSSAQTG